MKKIILIVSGLAVLALVQPAIACDFLCQQRIKNGTHNQLDLWSVERQNRTLNQLNQFGIGNHTSGCGFLCQQRLQQRNHNQLDMWDIQKQNRQFEQLQQGGILQW